MAVAGRRDDLLDKVTDHLLARGLGDDSLRRMAQAAGTSDRMLIYHFGDKAALMGAAFALAGRRLTAILDAARPAPMGPEALWQGLERAAGDPAIWPFLRLWLGLVARAAEGDAQARGHGQALAAMFHDWIDAGLALPPGEARRAQALALLQRLEGAVVLRAVGFPAEVRDITHPTRGAP